MTSESFTALLIQDNPGDIELVRQMLAEVGWARFDLEVVSRLSDGMERLAVAEVAVALVDLSLPDGEGLNVVSILRAHAPDLPIVVFTGMGDEEAGIGALAAGAQDYLIKGQTNSTVLVRALRYAIERKRLELALQRMALQDELTSLYNRRGFFHRAMYRLRDARREGKGAVLLMADMDGLKQVNDTLGHLEGDRALVEIARTLRETFREEDVIARMGGDEFAVLAIMKSDRVGDVVRAVLTRLRARLATLSLPSGNRLSMSVGHAAAQADGDVNLDALIKQADRSLYEQKRASRTVSSTDPGTGSGSISDPATAPNRRPAS
jgi:diguanylate cyclase (GGDEF)-like protein